MWSAETGKCSQVLAGHDDDVRGPRVGTQKWRFGKCTYGKLVLILYVFVHIFDIYIILFIYIYIAMICVCMCIYIFTNRSIYRNDIQKEVCVSMYDHPGVDNRIELSRTKKCGRTPSFSNLSSSL